MDVVRMYRTILRLTKKFPSIKRDQLLQDIKVEFHINKGLTDAKVIEEKIVIAQRSVQQLGMYVNLDYKQTNWSVDLEKNPFGKGNKVK